MPPRQIVRIERVDTLACVRPGRRYGRWLWFKAEEVPNLASGASGAYEIERLPKQPGQRHAKWRVVGPAPPR